MTVIAILGTGSMGSALARALTRAGHELVLYNRSRQRADRLSAEIGARVASTPADAVQAAAVAISMLADDDAVLAVYREAGGLLEGLHDGVVAVDMSTVRPSVIRSLEGPVRACGAGILDAPVSGSVALAEKGELTIMVGGRADDLERARPALAGIGNRILHVGPLGAGATMKLAVNTLIYGLNGALSEALVLAERAGIDRSLAYEVFAGSAVAAPFVHYKRAAFEHPDEAPAAFTLELAAKDLRLILDLAAETGAPMPQARTNLESVEATIAELGPEQDFSAVAGYLRRTARRTEEGR
jgi:3-hydroxyisobutyrate dehydrogenase-like beta-hydroxyacid dehydrogenase